MTEIKVRVEHPPVVLHMRPAIEMDEEQFCGLSRNWRIERTAEGDLEIVPPSGGDQRQERGDHHTAASLGQTRW